MKIAVVTDLHANREAVQAVLDHAQAQGAERHAFVGDFVGYGADPAWVVEKVREMVRGGAWAVQGNHDEAVAHAPGPNMRPDARRVVEWTQAQLNAAQRDFLASLPLTQECGELLFVHANAAEPAAWGYVHGRVEAAQSLQATGQRITFCGHMHEPRLYHLSAVGKTGDFMPVPGVPIPLLASRRWLAIPGSSGQPRDGDPAACYALYDTARSELTYWRVPYDVERAAAKIRAADLPPVLASRLLDGH
ncbi:MAG: metallophosphoesterase family protein [Betaproteobacteria bacterium]|nr:metallophosphoesterase family protein [Betaproteobacteria bacterium]